LLRPPTKGAGVCNGSSGFYIDFHIRGLRRTADLAGRGLGQMAVLVSAAARISSPARPLIVVRLHPPLRLAFAGGAGVGDFKETLGNQCGDDSLHNHTRLAVRTTHTRSQL